jgi:hypothetical protein
MGDAIDGFINAIKTQAVVTLTISSMPPKSGSITP